MLCQAVYEFQLQPRSRLKLFPSCARQNIEIIGVLTGDDNCLERSGHASMHSCVMAFPCSVFGPVLRFALARLAVICFEDVIIANS